jgi:hypothetical protein
MYHHSSHSSGHETSLSNLKGVLQSQQTRPLLLSHYVCEELPEILSKIRKGTLEVRELESQVAERCENQSLKDQFENLLACGSPARQRLALLDLTMLQSAVELSRGKIPAELITLVDSLAERLGAPPVLTYGLIVRDNPPCDMRGFCTGHVGDVERSFYLWPRKNRGSFRNSGKLRSKRSLSLH